MTRRIRISTIRFDEAGWSNKEKEKKNKKREKIGIERDRYMGIYARRNLIYPEDVISTFLGNWSRGSFAGYFCLRGCNVSHGTAIHGYRVFVNRFSFAALYTRRGIYFLEELDVKAFATSLHSYFLIIFLVYLKLAKTSEADFNDESSGTRNVAYRRMFAAVLLSA